MKLVTILLAALILVPGARAQDMQSRTLKICVAADAPAEVRRIAEEIRQAVARTPLLTQMGVNGVSVVDSKKLAAAAVSERAFHHLILVGLPEDPLIRASWQREALTENGGFYVFGFGHLRGTLGYLESGRNPFLHSHAVRAAPFETEFVTLTGSNVAGVKLAAAAFLQVGLVNGVVAAAGWTRPSRTILDRDPLTLPVVPITQAPASIGSATRVAVTQAAENEYREVLEDAGVMPACIWRVKYLTPGAWDRAAPLEAASPQAFLNGLNRRAIGNTLWIASFDTAADADEAASKIAAAAHMRADGSAWIGVRPSGDSVAERAPKPGEVGAPLFLWTKSKELFMSTVPEWKGN